MPFVVVSVPAAVTGRRPVRYPIGSVHPRFFWVRTASRSTVAAADWTGLALAAGAVGPCVLPRAHEQLELLLLHPLLEGAEARLLRHSERLVDAFVRLPEIGGAAVVLIAQSAQLLADGGLV